MARALVLSACLLVAARAVVMTSPKHAEHKVAEGLADETMKLSAHNLMEVKLGPFDSAGEACDYCFSSFTKEGVPPAGPVAPMCTCMAYQEGEDWTMFCSTPASAAGYVGDKTGGCTCQERDMEHMAATTCEPISS
mmetsp:Transcript_16466/g.29908  ORF Transcript_16466/g.29908 Transcript_16466/m.29908 type:complete len:136 (-) Transcript_16466:66-473(-)